MSASSVPLITLEEHFTSTAATQLHGPIHMEFGPAIGEKLSSLSTMRLDDMRTSGVSRQIISHTPFQTAPDLALCQAVNAELHAACVAHPEQFVGFATLPMGEPDNAAKELKRAVKELGFVGALVDTHAEGVFYDGPEYDVLWTAATELDVPIYIHPCYASDEMMRVTYRGNYEEIVAKGLGAWVFGWHVETGLHFLRLFAAGVFDRFPKLKIVLGHMGETLPYMLSRQEASTSRWTHLKRPLGEVWRTNVWVTTSGMFTTAPLQCLLKVSPPDRVLFSVDYPFSGNDKGRKFVEEIEKEGLLTGDSLRAFANGNAAKLLGL